MGHCIRRYLDMLPSTFGSSLWFTEEELAELEGTTLHRATLIQVHMCILLVLDLRLGILGGEDNQSLRDFVFLFQRKSLQSSFDEKVKGLVEELLHVDESARFGFNLQHFVLIFI